MRSSLRHWCLTTALPQIGDVLHLEELDARGAPTGQKVRVRVEATPRDLPGRPSSTQRLFSVDVPRDPPLCRCGHIRILHAMIETSDGATSKVRGACTICGEACERYSAPDARAEP